MKCIKLAICALTIICLSGCVPQNYYQLYSTNWDNADVSGSDVVFENEDLVISFDLWCSGGESSFSIYNKTDSDLYVDLSRSHLIINNLAKTYYQNRRYTKSSATNKNSEVVRSNGVASGSSTTRATASSLGNYAFGNATKSSSYSSRSTTNLSSFSISNGYAVTFVEEKVVCIPAESAKFFSGFGLIDYLFRTCDFNQYPSKKDSESIEFTKGDSPLVVTNVVSYGFELETMENYSELRNTFWVNKISNYHSEQFVEFKYPEYCGEKSMHSQKYFKYESPNQFYLKYYKSFSNEY